MKPQAISDLSQLQHFDHRATQDMLSKPGRTSLHVKASGDRTGKAHSDDCILIRRGFEVGPLSFRDGVNNGIARNTVRNVQALCRRYASTSQLCLRQKSHHIQPLLVCLRPACISRSARPYTRIHLHDNISAVTLQAFATWLPCQRMIAQLTVA